MKFYFLFLLIVLIQTKPQTLQKKEKQEQDQINLSGTVILNDNSNYQMADGTTYENCEKYKLALQDNLLNGFYEKKNEPGAKMYCNWDYNQQMIYKKQDGSKDFHFLREQIETEEGSTTENEIQQEEKIGIILLGYSQTGKSSTINQLFGSQIAEQGEYGMGESCTKISKSYVFKTLGGRQVLVIDTQGFSDNRMEMIEQDERVLQTELQQLLASFVQEIIDFGATKFYFILTESLASDTFQFTKNYYKLYKLLGQTALQSSLILATKYNPKSQDPINIISQTKRLESIKQQIKNIEKSQGIKIHLQTFQTIPYDENGNPFEFFPQISHVEALEQEQQLFSQLDELKSYPVQIFTDYVKFCEKRINELYNTNGIGIKQYPIQKITYIDEKKFKNIEVPSRNFFKAIFGIDDTLTIPYYVKIPVEHTEMVTKEIKSIQDISKMYMNDSTYKQERQEHIKYLFQKYDKF